MEHNHSDEFMRAKLKNAVVPPPPFVWEGVERALERNRRKHFAWFRAFGFLLFGALVGGAWLWHSNSTPALSQPTTPNTPSTVAPQLALPIVENAASTTNSPLQASTKHSIESDIPNNNNSTATNYKISAKTPQKTIFSPNTNTTYNKITGQTGTQTSEAIHTSLPEQGQILAPDYNAVEKRSRANTSTGYFLMSEKIGMLPSGTMAQSLHALHHLLPQRLATLKPTRLNNSRYNLDERRSAWLADAYTGPILSQKILTTATSSPEADIYRQLRLDTEGTGWGFNAGVRATRLFGGHWLVGAGVDYQQFTEQFTYAQEAQIQYAVENTDTIAATFGRRSMVRYNRFGFVSLPISVGHEWRKKRMGIQVRMGAAANIYFWKNGTILHPDTFQPTAIDHAGPGGEAVYKTSAGFEAQASAQAFWHFRRDIRIFVEPFCETSLNALTLSKFPTSQRNRTYGLKWGLSKIF